MSLGAPIRLTSLKIERFKASFKPPAVDLLDFNVIIGRNGSGKSTLLESLQWIDTAFRRDAIEACDRYSGISDLINLRSRVEQPYFQVDIHWSSWASVGGNSDDDYHYVLRVEDRERQPFVSSEFLSTRVAGDPISDVITPQGDGRRDITPTQPTAGAVRILDPHRLALARLSDTRFNDPAARAVENFWNKAVFLRLSPSRLALGSSSFRKSFEPILDEEGTQLAALLKELTREQREELVKQLREILPGIRDVNVAETGVGPDQRANYSLLERMPYRGRSGKWQFPIPAWMLSEGTRRITALLALLIREPAPSLICIEEIENGLDPWSVRRIVGRLREARYRDTQIILTTHSPWLLDHVPLDSVLLVRRTDGDTVYDRFLDIEEVNEFDPSLAAGVRYVNLEDRTT